LREQIAKFKIRQIKIYGIFAKIAKFNARQTFPLCGTTIALNLI